MTKETYQAGLEFIQKWLPREDWAEAFIVLRKAERTFDPSKGSIGTYINKALRNKRVDKIRQDCRPCRARYRSMRPVVCHWDKPIVDHRDELEFEMATLQEESKLMVTLLSRGSIKETAEAMGVKFGTIKSRTHAMRQNRLRGVPNDSDGNRSGGQRLLRGRVGAGDRHDEARMQASIPTLATLATTEAWLKTQERARSGMV